MKSMNFIWVSGATIFLLLVVPSTHGATIGKNEGTALFNAECDFWDETTDVLPAKVCKFDKHLLCYKDAKAQPTVAHDLVKAKESGKCYCPLDADKSDWDDTGKVCGPPRAKGPVGHGEACAATTGGCKGKLQCLMDATKGESDKTADKGGTTWELGAPAGMCLCNNLMHISATDECGPDRSKKVQWSQECESGGCVDPFKCIVGGVPATEDNKADYAGSDPWEWAVGSPVGKCICASADKPVHKAGKCEKEDRVSVTGAEYGKECDSEGCVVPFACRVGGKVGGANEKDYAGTGPWTLGSPKGTCVCAASTAPVHKDGECGKQATGAVKGHGEPCGPDECDKKFTCRVGGKKGEKDGPDEQGEREWKNGYPDANCVCPAGEGIKADSSGCEKKKSGGGTDNPAPPGTSGSDRIVYQLMSTVAAAGSLLLL